MPQYGNAGGPPARAAADRLRRAETDPFGAPLQHRDGRGAVVAERDSQPELDAPGLSRAATKTTVASSTVSPGAASTRAVSSTLALPATTRLRSTGSERKRRCGA